MWAAWRNNFKMVDYLIEEGADIHETNKEGLNALDL
jgi:ankyrin repeat protein